MPALIFAVSLHINGPEEFLSLDVYELRGPDAGLVPVLVLLSLKPDNRHVELPGYLGLNRFTVLSRSHVARNGAKGIPFKALRSEMAKVGAVRRRYETAREPSIIAG